MEAYRYLDRLLARYAATFSIYKPYIINHKKYPAYGYFFSHTEKYVLIREANLWTSECYEHILFLEEEYCTEETISEIDDLLKRYMEPKLVRNGKDNPEANHMYSYLTIVVLSEHTPEKSVEKKLRHYSYEKGYMLNTRGYSQAHIILVDLEKENVFTNYQARKQKSMYKKIFSEVREGKIGFEALSERDGFEAYTQEEEGVFID